MFRFEEFTACIIFAYCKSLRVAAVIVVVMVAAAVEVVVVVVVARPSNSSGNCFRCCFVVFRLKEATQRHSLRTGVCTKGLQKTMHTKVRKESRRVLTQAVFD